MSEVFTISGQNLHGSARAAVMDGFTSLSEMKNVPLNPALREALAEGVLQRMDFASLYQLAGQEEQGLTAMVREVDAELNATVLARMWHLIALFEGKNDFNDPAVRATARVIIDKFMATLPKQGAARWPDPMQLVADHYATVPRGPIVETESNGTVLTTYWLDRKPHRDPGDGPAVRWTRGQKEGCEYWVNGQLHRPHEDGPAMIYTHYKKFELSGEEYFENGKWHRPSELGPAVTHWDRKGEPVMILYHENGQLHRDPKQGPAWWHIHDARTGRNAARPFTEIRYCVRGQPHRDEKDGPAWIKRDNQTGVLVTEEYWRDGYLYRENGPAIIERSPEGAVRYEAYWRGERYRDASEGPATIVYDAEGRIQTQEWFGKDGRHRDGGEGPGRTSYLSGGWVQEDFYIDGVYRPAVLGPASVTRDQAGNVVREEFWDGGRMHVRRPEIIKAEATAHG